MSDLSLRSEDEGRQHRLDQAQKLANSINATVARALRLQANGQEVDAAQIRNQAGQAYEQLLALLPAEQMSQQVACFPVDLMAHYGDVQQERKTLAATGLPALNAALSGGLERDRLSVLWACLALAKPRSSTRSPIMSTSSARCFMSVPRIRRWRC